MRLYTFTNTYLSSIQKAIQTTHCAVEMAFNWLPIKEQWDQYQCWATRHKTLIVLDGGNQFDLKELLYFFDNTKNRYPYAGFREDEQSLNGCLTCVGIVLPASIYEAAWAVREKKIWTDQLKATGFVLSVDPYVEVFYNDWQLELIERLSTYNMAY